jgi:hypothetical protein
VSDEIDSHKSAISFLTFFKETIQTITVVKPSKASFDFPALPTVTLLVLILWRSPFWNRHVIFTILGIRYDLTFPQFSSEWFAIVAFVESQAFRSAATFADFDAIYRFKDLALVVPVGFAQSKVEWIAVGVNDHMAFEALQTVFS